MSINSNWINQNKQPHQISTVGTSGNGTVPYNGLFPNASDSTRLYYGVANKRRQ